MRYFTFFCTKSQNWCVFYIHSTSGCRVLDSYLWLLMATLDHRALELSFPKLVHLKNADTDI